MSANNDTGGSDVSDNKNPKRPKSECPYGDKCYRLNPIHFKEYSHKHRKY